MVTYIRVRLHGAAYWVLSAAAVILLWCKINDPDPLKLGSIVFVGVLGFYYELRNRDLGVMWLSVIQAVLLISTGYCYSESQPLVGLLASLVALGFIDKALDSYARIGALKDIKDEGLAEHRCYS